jgi:UDP-N-acetylmuramoyl-tripeptide--D-alanyl-D-alanine ligase
MKLSFLAELLNADLLGQDVAFNGIATNSKEVNSDDLFIARCGTNLDGHEFVVEAQKLGAPAALVERKLAVDIPQVIVANTTEALGKLGAWKRRQFSGKLLAVTGSCGKTTTKTMLAAIMQNFGKTLVSVKSYNNNVGIPLTLWNLNADYDYAVLEVGANHHGEIASLTQLIQPLDVAVICNAEPCHLEGFGDVSGVARAKGELFQGLSSLGVGIINADNDHYNYWRKLLHGHRYLSFGVKNPADIVANNIIVDDSGQPQFMLQLPSGSCDIKLSVFGVHNIMNALAAAAAAYAVDIPITAIKAGLENTAPTAMRLVPQTGYAGARIIDDTYNANPQAVAAALEVLLLQNGKKVFIFGGMRELGDAAKYWHSYVGKLAKDLGVQELYVCGQYSDLVAQAFGSNAYAFQRQEELITAVQVILDENTVVLVKGSRGAMMEKVVKALKS